MSNEHIKPVDTAMPPQLRTEERDPAYLVDGRYAITDLVDLEQLRDLFEKFSQATGCTIGFLDHPGLNILIATAWRPVCTRFHRSCEEAAAMCMRSNHHLLDQLEQPGQTVIEACEHGLVDCATPIFIKGKHVASLATGQILLAPPDRQRFRQQAQRFGYEEEAYLKALDGVPVVSEEKIRSITAFLGSMASLISQLGYTRLAEIEEREHATQVIRENEKQLNSIMELSPISMVVVGLGGAIEYLNRKAGQMLGYTLEDIPTMEHWWRRAFPEAEYRNEVVATWSALTQEAVDKQHEIEGREYQITCRDGAVKTMLVFGVPVAEKMLIILEDVTDRRKAEEQLLESNRRLELAVKTAKMGVWDWDIPGNRVHWDEQMYRVYGLEHKTGLDGAELWLTSLHPEDADYAWEACNGALQGTGDYDTVYRIKPPDGQIRYIKADGMVLRGKDGQPVRMLGVNYDITERRQTEERLHQAEKMDAIGQLAGGVAHDFNNMLGGIIGAAELLNHKLQGREDTQPFLAMILNAAERAAELTGKLLAFARKQPMASTPIDINLPLRDACALLMSTADRRIKVRMHLDHETLPVVGDLTQFQNTFLNLLINAAHAMPEGGDIVIVSRRVELDEESCKASTFNISPGLFAKVEIRDTGRGIVPEHLPHIFEPFFTTKASGKGTGLGLAAVLGTVQQYKGAITVYSEPGARTSFQLFFPLSEKDEAVSRQLYHGAVNGKGTILIVDDEYVMRQTAAEILKSLGYKVLLAEDGLQGLEVFRREHGRINLVILDMIMPEISGRDCFFAMREIEPGVRVILSSGFSREEELLSMKAAGLKGFIHKPYRLAEFSRVVHAALSDAPLEAEHG